jgi:hypothetical protein
VSSSEQTERLDQQMAPWICEVCAHFMVLVIERTTSPSSCPQSNRGHRLIRYTGTAQAVALRQQLEARGHDQQTDKARISR